MSKLKRNNGSSIAPCIISKAKYALRLKAKKPINTKSCSRKYWEEVIEIVGKEAELNEEIIYNAKKMHNKF